MSSSFDIIGLFCSNQVPPAITSSQSLWIKFRSDVDGTANGFLATYSYGNLKKISKLSYIYLQNSSVFTVKLVEHSGVTGVITSPRYPNYLYAMEGRYTYRISVDVGFAVQIIFDICFLKRDSHIKIFDGYDDINSDVLATQRTDEISSEPIVSSSNVVFISFKIETFSESKFSLRWNKVAVPQITNANKTFVDNLNCTENSVITLQPRSPKQIMSPGYPGGYDTSQHCKWTFTPAQNGYHVMLRIVSLDLEPTSDCSADYVQVSSTRDMEKYNDSARICTPDSDIPVYHGDPNLKLEFVSDSYLNRSGFAAEVTLGIVVFA